MRRFLLVSLIVFTATALTMAQTTAPAGGTTGGTGAAGAQAPTAGAAPGATGTRAVPSAAAPAAPSGIGGNPAQQPVTGVNQTTAPVSNMPSTNQAPANNTGVGVVTPGSPTGPTTPIITLGTTSPNPVGASSATPGNQAGATNSTLQPTITGGVAPQTEFTTPVIVNLPNSAVIGSSSANANNLPATGRDLIVSSDSAWAISTNTMGVAEAARQARAVRASSKSRRFTNADILRLRGQAPISVVGNTNPPVTNEQTMPASDVEDTGATTPNVPAPEVQPPANQAPPAQSPKSPFGAKPSPLTEPR